MEQVKKEASKFLSGSSGQRAVVDGLKVYSEKELEEEMGRKRPVSSCFRAVSDQSLSRIPFLFHLVRIGAALTRSL